MNQLQWTYFSNEKRVVKGIEYILLQFDFAESLYWEYVPKAYHRWYQRKYTNFQCPFDPLEILSVSPAQINRFTGRQSAPLCRKSLGKIKSGDWDQKGKENWYNTNPNDPNEKVFSGTHFCGTTFYQSLKRRFHENADWESTDLYKILRRNLDDWAALRGYKTESELIDRLKKIDTMYLKIKQDGYKRQKDLTKSQPNFNEIGFLGQLTNEVCVDVSRDGEFLFVDGKHRLAIAKILDLESIPVVVLTRHSEWMDTRDRLYQLGKDSNHPDLKKC